MHHVDRHIPNVHATGKPRRIVRSLMAAAILAAATAAASPADAHRGRSYTVTTAADDGPGSLRAGLADGRENIRIDRSVGDITILSPLTFTGRTLSLRGSGQSIVGEGLDATLLHTTGTSDVEISRLDFTDGGGYGLPPSGENGYGIHIEIPADATGRIDVDLDRVTVSGVGGHGVFVDDNQASPASVRLDVSRVTVTDVGTGGFDQDGIRVDETGEGDIRFTARRSSFTDVGADGVELDERGPGNVTLDVSTSVFNANGDYCAPIDPSTPPYADPTCVEDDDGDLVLDLDDGFDVDEADDGSILGQVSRSELVGNLDEGLDFDEAGNGDIDVRVSRVTAKGNTDEGIKFSEEDAGSQRVHLSRVVSAEGGDDGIQLEEAGAGSIRVDISSSTFTDNAKHGINIEEADDGDLSVTASRGAATGNGKAGIAAEQEDDEAGDPDTGTIEVRRMDLSGNADGELDLDGVSTV